MKKEIKANNKGFSLVELIVVVAIMAVLMVVLAPAMLRYVEKTRIQKDDSAASEVLKAVELALADESIYAEANGGEITVTITTSGGTGTLAFTNAASGATTTKLESEVKATVGDSIKISSKKRGSNTCTIKAAYKSSRQGYVVEFASGTDNGWN